MSSRIVRRLVIGALGVLAAWQGGVACTGGGGLAGLGEACSLATDCADGLVCIVQKNGGRTCSSDVASVIGKPPGGTEDATDSGAEESDGAVEGDGATPEPDASSPDASKPTEDAGFDAGPGEPDAGPGEVDAGPEPEPDAGDDLPDASDAG